MRSSWIVIMMLTAGVAPSARRAVVPEMQQRPGPGAALRPGARLTYGSGGTSQPPWQIDSVELGVALGGRTGCSRVILRMRTDQPTPETRTLCLAGDTLLSWSASAGAWRPQRPIGPGMELRIPQPNGGTVLYTTGEAGVATIGGRTFPFVETVVQTLDPSGNVIRRLRERYALSLTTALGGTFEVPDPAAAGGWRETQRFELVAVEIP